MSELQIKTSRELAKLFPDYVNGLRLKDEDGNRLENEITLYASPVSLSMDMAVPTMVLARQKDFDDELWCKMHFDPIQDGDYAGMVVYLSNQYYYRGG